MAYILDHASDFIEANEGRGFGEYTESSLECNYKILRSIRIAKSRKCSQVDNLTDCINRLWVRSDVQVRNAIPLKKIMKNTSLLLANYNSWNSLPFPSLADYYIKELVLEE